MTNQKPASKKLSAESVLLFSMISIAAPFSTFIGFYAYYAHQNVSENFQSIEAKVSEKYTGIDRMHVEANLNEVKSAYGRCVSAFSSESFESRQEKCFNQSVERVIRKRAVNSTHEARAVLALLASLEVPGVEQFQNESPMTTSEALALLTQNP